MPDTKPNINFDEEGVCSACRAAERKDKGIDWKEREKQFRELLDQYRNKDGSNYDCIVGVSGGKDSHFIVHTLLKYKMNPLCVTFAPCKSTELGKENLENLQNLGVDHILITPKRDVYRKLFRLGLEKICDHCMPCHYGIFTTAPRFAVKLNVPLIVWGENIQMEYGGTEEEIGSPYLDQNWLLTHGCPVTKDGKPYPPEEWVGEYGITKEDLIPYTYPSEEELKRVGVRGVFLGYYFKWNIREQLEIVKEDGFRSKGNHAMGTYADYENLDGLFVGAHDMLKYTKYGFGRATDHACTDIRYGLLDRDRAVDLVRKYDGKYDNRESREAFFEFLKFLEPPMTEEEFWEIVDAERRPEAWEKDKDGNWVMKAKLKKSTE